MKRTSLKFYSLLSLAILLPAICNPVNSMESKIEEFSNNREFTQSISLSNKNSTEISIPPIDWGILTNYFAIENVQAGMHEEVSPTTGWVDQVPLLTFIVEAKRSFTTTLFSARFYDSQGIEVDSFSPVQFEPLYDTWNQGMRSRANIILPRDMSNVAVIKFSQL